MGNFIEYPAIEVPKQKDIWETIKKENPGVSEATLADIKSSINRMDPRTNRTISSLEANLSTQISNELYNTHGESNTLSVLSSYAEAMPEGDDHDGSKLFHILSTIGDTIEAVKRNAAMAPTMENLSMRLARTLSQKKIWNDYDRSARSVILKTLTELRGDRKTEEGKKIINDAVWQFINSIKDTRNNRRDLLEDDIETALLAIGYKDEHATLSEVASSIIGNVDESEWPLPDYLDNTEDFGYPGDGDEEEFHDYHEHEETLDRDWSEGRYAVVKDAVINNTIEEIKETVCLMRETFETIPEKIIPALQLHLFNDIIKNKETYSPSEGRDHLLSKFKNFIEEEKRAEESSYLPTIGVEIEVPSYFDVNNDLCRATVNLGIPQGFDESWEFATDFSYSARTQSALVHELIRGGFIETQNDTVRGGKKIRGSGDFSLHINLGVYPDIQRMIKNSDRELLSKYGELHSKYEDSADVLTNALTYAFTSPDRLDKRKTNTRFNTWKESKPSKKKRSTSCENDSSCRIEVRSLEVRDKTLYRMLVESQLLGEALLSDFSPNKNKVNENLSRVWDDFRKEVEEVLKKNGLSLYALDDQDSRPYISAKVLRETDIQNEMRSIITKSARKIFYIIEASKKNPE